MKSECAPVTPFNADFLTSLVDPDQGTQGHLLAIPLVFEICGRGRIRAAAIALASVVARHFALRARYFFDGHRWMQEVTDSPVAWLGGGPRSCEIGQSDAEQSLRTAIGRTRMLIDLDRGQPLAAAILRLGADRSLLVVLVNHLSCDGVSAGILSRDLHAFYVGALSGAHSPAKPVTTQVTDWAKALESLAATTFTAEIPFWKAQVSAASHIAYPFDDHNGINTPSTEARLVGRLDKHETSQLLRSHLNRLGRGPLPVAIQLG